MYLESTTIVVELCIAFFCAICAINTFLTRRDEPARSNHILLLLLLGMITMVGSAWTGIYAGQTSTIACFLTRIGNVIVFSSMPLMLISVAYYIRFLMQAHGGRLASNWIRILMILVGTHLLVVLLSLYTGFAFSFDEFNYYHRGNGYVLIAILGVLEIAHMTIMVITCRHLISRYEMIALVLFGLLPFIALLIQYTLGEKTVYLEISSSFCMILFFMFHQVEKTSRLLSHKAQVETLAVSLEEKEQQLKEAHIRISISQMQPHFIFNALGSIEQLCHANPLMAAEATHRFAYYLRTNLMALSNTGMKSFDDELSHIRTYVWLEQMRFGDDIEYSEEIRVSDFSIPVLTIQPLVENAIKHGMMGDSDAVLHVRLKTWKKDGNYYIEVADDGCGFDVNDLPADNSVHVGLYNVRSRLELMCNGQLQIKSTPGKGSRFTIRIPDTTGNVQA